MDLTDACDLAIEAEEAGYDVDLIEQQQDGTFKVKLLLDADEPHWLNSAADFAWLQRHISTPAFVEARIR